MLFRLFIAAVFLFAQLSLSWASGVSVHSGANADSGGDTVVQAAHAHAPDSTSASGETHQFHDAGGCNADCHICVLVLPSVARVAGIAAPMFENIVVLSAMPPGMVSHPYRPPTVT